MMRSFVVLSVVCLGLALNAHTAEAKCASPGITFAPASGSKIDASTTWVFVPTWRAENVDIEVKSAHPTSHTVTKVSSNDTFSSFRVDVTVESMDKYADYEVTVNGHAAKYRLSAGAAPTASGPVTLSDAGLDSDHWTCSFDENAFATPSLAAPAYRVEWAPTEDAYRAGERQSLVVPGSMMLFWGDKEAEPKIALGHLSCFGETIPVSDLKAGTFVGVTALRTGSEATPVDPYEVKLDPFMFELRESTEPEVEEANDPNEYVCGYAYSRRLEREAKQDKNNPSRRLALLGILFGLIAGVFFGRRLSKSAADRLDALCVPQLFLVASAILATITQSSMIAQAVAIPIGVGAFALGTVASILAVLVQQNR